MRNNASAHRKLIKGLHYLESIKKIVTGSWDKSIKIWDKNGNYLKTINAHAKR
jgi:WD40 repeat protein